MTQISKINGVPVVDTFVTGGTYVTSASTITLSRNDAVNISITGITSGADSYVTGSTFSDVTLTLDRNNGLSAITTDLTGINVETFFLKDSVGTINVGEVVFAKNWNDANSVVSVALADATSGAGTMPAVGICTVSGSSVVQGKIITNGTHEGFDTSAWSLNNALYISETPGVLTNVRPTGDTADIQTIGRVLKVDAVDGVKVNSSVFVTILTEDAVVLINKLTLQRQKL